MSEPRMTLAAANALDAAAFVAAFGDVAEHSPWVAETAAARRPYADRETMVSAFADAIASAPADAQRALVLAHPDLAGRAALAGEVTDDSAREQASAGLDTLTPEEFRTFTEANTAYRQRFGFPFILAVRNATKHTILDAFRARLDNTAEAELAEALAQVRRIVRFRLEDRVAP